MIKLENERIFGWESAIRGMRNPMNSWSKSDSVFIDDEGDWYTINGDSGPFTNVEELTTDGEQVCIGENDLKLMKTLAGNGPVHAKYRRMITVYVDITAPLYWWKEFDTYKVGTVANSCSTMHKISEKEFALDDFSWEHLNEKSLFILKSTISYLNVIREHYTMNDTKDKNLWWQMIQLLPSSYNQKRTVMMNYEVLSNIYRWRKNHKLDEWRYFCGWVDSLPYSELIIDNKE